MHYNFAFCKIKYENFNNRTLEDTKEIVNWCYFYRLYPILTFFVHIMYKDLEPTVMLRWVDK
jgi:hypothetical protein